MQIYVLSLLKSISTSMLKFISTRKMAPLTCNKYSAWQVSTSSTVSLGGGLILNTPMNSLSYTLSVIGVGMGLW